MTYRVIQWATGTVGIHSVPAIAAHPDLELVGLWVHSDSKAGRDAGEVCGSEPVGVVSTQDMDHLLYDVDADVVVYMANSDLRPDGVIDDICKMLVAGKNVVNTSFVALLHLDTERSRQTYDRIQSACLEGGTSFYTSGIDPGFGNAGITIPSLALCKEVHSVRMAEIVNYATWDNPFTMFDIMGFGKKDPAESLLLAPGSTTLAWGPVIEMVAAALDVELAGIEEWNEIIYADESFEIDSGTIEVGTISGMHFEIRGMVANADGELEARIIVEHVTRLRDGDAPHWPQGDGYKIDVKGEPNLHLELSLSSDIGDHNHAGCLATAMHVINAIPAVVAAEPGVLSYIDLPVYSARHLLV